MQSCIAMTLPLTEPAQYSLKQLREEELRNVFARGEWRSCCGCRLMNGRHGFIVRDLLIFLASRFQVSDPESGKVQAARVAHAAVILHVLALGTFEEQRSVARGAKLHAVGIRRATFRAGHSSILLCSADSLCAVFSLC